MRLARAATATVGLVAGAYFALWACAPAASLPPPVPLGEDHPNQFGAATAWTQMLGGPYTGNDLQADASSGPSAQVWYDRQLGRRFHLGGVIFGGAPTLYGAGVRFAADFVAADTFRFGGGVAAGFLWGEADLYVAGRLAEPLWIYTSPSIGVRTWSGVRLPVGLVWRPTPRWSFFGEAAAATDPSYQPLRSVSVTGALGAGYAF